MIIRERGNGKLTFNIFGYTYILLFSLICFLPFWLILSGSFTSESEIVDSGFKLFPKEISLKAYEVIFRYPQEITMAYVVSIVLTLFGAAAGLFLVSMTSYVLYRKDFKYRNYFSFFFYFTTLFSGGLVPFYLLIVKYLQLKNTFFALLLPSLMSAWLILLMKNFMKAIPDSIVESAKIDGAGDFTIYLKFILPLSGSGLATIGLFIALAYWNDWFTAMLFIEDKQLFPLQYLLYKTLQSIEGFRAATAKAGVSITVQMPTESLKMATAMIATGPIILLYPFVQKYFIKGLTIGSVKG